MLADGLARGGPDEARTRLAEFWRAASLGGNLPDAQRAVLERVLSMFPVSGSPMQLFVDTMSRLMSPYDFNPLNINPLKDLIERFVDFDAIRNYKDLELFVSATNVHMRPPARVPTRGCQRRCDHGVGRLAACVPRRRDRWRALLGWRLSPAIRRCCR